MLRPPRADLHANMTRAPWAVALIRGTVSVPINTRIYPAALELHADPPALPLGGWPRSFGPGTAIFSDGFVPPSRMITRRLVSDTFHIQDVRRVLGHLSFIGRMARPA